MEDAKSPIKELNGLLGELKESDVVEAVADFFSPADNTDDAPRSKA